MIFRQSTISGQRTATCMQCHVAQTQCMTKSYMAARPQLRKNLLAEVRQQNITSEHFK